MAEAEDSGRRRQVAVQVALRAGLLKSCPVHGDVYDPGQRDFQGACMVATYLVNRDDPLVAPFRGDRVALTSLLKSICESYGAACPTCRESDRHDAGPPTRPGA